MSRALRVRRRLNTIFRAEVADILTPERLRVLQKKRVKHLEKVAKKSRLIRYLRKREKEVTITFRQKSHKMTLCLNGLREKTTGKRIVVILDEHKRARMFFEEPMYTKGGTGWFEFRQIGRESVNGRVRVSFPYPLMTLLESKESAAIDRAINSNIKSMVFVEATVKAILKIPRLI